MALRPRTFDLLPDEDYDLASAFEPQAPPGLALSPMDEEEAYIRSILGPEPSMEPTAPELEQPGRLQSFLESLAGIQQNPNLTGVAAFGQGLARGVGRTAAARGAKREDRNTEARRLAAKKDAANQAATLRYATRAGELLAKRGEEKRKEEAETKVLTEQDLKDMPWLGRAYKAGERAPRSLLIQKPEKPEKPADPTSYNTAVRSSPKIQRFEQIRFGADLVKQGNASKSPAGDIAMVYGYMKMLDPTSVVREGEFATAANAAGVPERIRQQYNNMLKGDLLDQKVRDDYVKNADAIYRTEHGQYSKELELFNRQGAAQGLSPDLMRPIEPFQSIVVQPSKAAKSVVDKVLGGRN